MEFIKIKDHFGNETKYYLGEYNKFDDQVQYIRLSDGCPNNCPYCYAPKDIKVYKIPQIVRNEVKILDDNLTAKPEAARILNELGDKRVNGKVIYYELICGIDFRFMTDNLAILLKQNRFRKIRLAWDWGFKFQKKIQSTIKMLVKAGYYKKEIQVFMLCNWKIPYSECLRKLDALKIWNVQVSDCYFDNQLPPNVKPIHWTKTQIKDFRKKCRKHNQLIRHDGVDPEYGIDERQSDLI